MVEWHHWLNGHEFEQILGDGERQGCLTCCSLWVHKESDMTEWLNNKISWLFMKNAAMNQWIWEYRYLYNVLFSFPLYTYPVVRLLDHLLDHMVVLFVNFWGNSILFSTMDVPFTFPHVFSFNGVTFALCNFHKDWFINLLNSKQK